MKGNKPKFIKLANSIINTNEIATCIYDDGHLVTLDSNAVVIAYDNSAVEEEFTEALVSLPSSIKDKCIILANGSFISPDNIKSLTLTNSGEYLIINGINNRPIFSFKSSDYDLDVAKSKIEGFLMGSCKGAVYVTSKPVEASTPSVLD